MASPARRQRHEEVGTTCAAAAAHEHEHENGTSGTPAALRGPLHPTSSPPQSPGAVQPRHPPPQHYRTNDLAVTPTSSHRCGHPHRHLDPYKTLSLRRDATAAEVTAAYRKLSLLHHPSRRRGDGDGDAAGEAPPAASDNSTTRRASIRHDGADATTAASAASSGMFVAVSASYQTLIEPRYRRRYDATTKSKSCTDEETGQLYYPALSTTGTGGSDSLGVSMSMSMSAGGVGSMSMSLGLGPTCTTATASIENGDRLDGCSTATSSNPGESFGGSAFNGLVGLGSGVPVNNAMRNSVALDELNGDTNADVNTNSDVNANANADAMQEDDDEGSACWAGTGCGVVCGAASTLADLELAGANSLDGEDGDGGPPAVSTSGSSDAAASPPNPNPIFDGRRHLLGNRSPRSIGSESDYDVGAEALDALLLGVSTDADDIILTSLRQHQQQPRMRRSGGGGGGGGGASSGGLGRHPFPSDGTQDGGQHYTLDQTDLLFGGPLAPLYRARNFSPFEDAYKLFDRIMGSAVFRADDAGTDNAGHTETERSRLAHRGPGQSASVASAESGFLTLAALPVPRPQTAGAMKTTIVATGASSYESDSEIGAAEIGGSAPKLPMKKEPGTQDAPKIIKRTERVVNGRRMIRTETTITDPKTSKRRTTIEVTKEDIIADQGEEEKDLYTGLSTQKVGPAAAAERQDDECGVCDRCGAGSVAPEGGAAAFELNPLLCGRCGRETPRGEQLAPSLRPDPSKLDPSEEEPLLERVSRQLTDFFSCGVGCGGASLCFAD